MAHRNFLDGAAAAVSSRKFTVNPTTRRRVAVLAILLAIAACWLLLWTASSDESSPVKARETRGSPARGPDAVGRRGSGERVRNAAAREHPEPEAVEPPEPPPAGRLVGTIRSRDGG